MCYHYTIPAYFVLIRPVKRGKSIFQPHRGRYEFPGFAERNCGGVCHKGKVTFFDPNGAGTSFPVSRSEIAAASAAKGKSHFSTPTGLKFVVRAKRLELTHPKVLEPKSNASANSATPAQKKMVTRPGFEPGTP